MLGRSPRTAARCALTRSGPLALLAARPPTSPATCHLPPATCQLGRTDLIRALLTFYAATDVLISDIVQFRHLGITGRL
ncbi:hypothetical protein SGFS_098290 [Streptomyces graminofaciens]|uniref:Secreted protein n=1 Tax=Streptomyces graminofaciens TaxID=68212 RepID=A0ABM7FQL0_9ACTN|nr:hypothetical protein SGFS_098290 [Streptomyces graminofaciens]